MSAEVTLKTIRRSDPEFRGYLDGTFSEHQRALPIRSLNINSVAEEITFEIRDVANIVRPSAPLVLLKLLRPLTLTFSFGSLLVVWFAVSPLMGHSINRVVAISGLLAIICFHGSVNLLSEYYDHVKGQDRINSTGGSRAIQLGWISAIWVWRLGLIFLAAAIVLALPTLLVRTEIVLLLAVVSLFAGLEFSTQRLRLKDNGWGEWIVFFMMGPLLCLSYEWTLSGHMGPIISGVGTEFGFISLLFFHIGNVRDIIVDAQLGRRTWAVRLGFDRARAVIYGICFLIAGVNLWLFSLVELSGFSLASLYAIRISDLWRALPLLLPIIGCARIAWLARRLDSPLSSELAVLSPLALRLHIFTVLAFGGYFFISRLV